jgi:hypothetical protein
LYTLYCDVGKNIESLAVDNDSHNHDIVPNIHFSADCVAFFGENTDDDVAKIEQSIKDWKVANADYIRSKGYDIDSTKLTPGRIEIGRLETELTKEDLLDKLKNYNNIQSLHLQ